MPTNQDKFELLARAGYAARGVVYFIIGGLALFSVFGGGGEEDVGSQGALSSLLSQPFGRILLALIGVGFIGHVLWRLTQSLLNADRHGHDAKGWAIRAGLFASALLHSFLAFTALQMALGGSSSGGGEGGGATAWLMQQPFGRYLVGALGLAIIVAGGAQIYKGLSGKFCDWLSLPARAMPVLYAACAAGLAARGTIFVIIGVFFLYAGFTVDPQQAGGLAEALAWLRGLPFGAWLYALFAAGLFAFGAYSIVEALYRRMNTAEVEQKGRKAAAALG